MELLRLSMAHSPLRIPHFSIGTYLVVAAVAAAALRSPIRRAVRNSYITYCSVGLRTITSAGTRPWQEGGIGFDYRLQV